MPTVVLLEEAVSVDDKRVDVFAPDVLRRLCEFLGPEIESQPVGVNGSGRRGHWLESGVVLMTQERTRELIALYVCFEEEGQPFANIVAKATVFRGEVVFDGRVFSSGATESYVRSVPGIGGIGGVPTICVGRLFVGFDLRKSVGKLGKRTGVRKLVQISAEWGGPKSFIAD